MSAEPQQPQSPSGHLTTRKPGGLPAELPRAPALKTLATACSATLVLVSLEGLGPAFLQGRLSPRRSRLAVTPSKTPEAAGTQWALLTPSPWSWFLALSPESRHRWARWTCAGPPHSFGCGKS